SVDWRADLTKVGGPPVDRVNVGQPGWCGARGKALSGEGLGGRRADLRLLGVRSAAEGLPRAVEGRAFGFGRRARQGAEATAPRWKGCIGLLDGDVGDAVGRISVARYFQDDARARMKTMIDALIAAFRADMASAEWLGPAARAEAQAKLAKMIVVTGMSNR